MVDRAKVFEKASKEHAKGIEQLHQARAAYGSLFQENPTHAYNHKTGQLEAIKKGK